MFTCLVRHRAVGQTMSLQGLLGSLVDELCHAIPDALGVLQRGPMNPPLVQATPADVAEEVGSPREEHVVGQDHGPLAQQTGALQHLQQTRPKQRSG